MGGKKNAQGNLKAYAQNAMDCLYGAAKRKLANKK